jgi:hypothetical protein
VMVQIGRDMKRSIGGVGILFVLIFTFFSWESKAPTGGDHVPTTSVLSGEESSGGTTINMRRLASPLLFSFPSRLGYSGVVHEEDNKIDITFVQSVQKERYFSPNWLMKNPVGQRQDALMISSKNKSIDFEPAYTQTRLSVHQQRIVLRNPLHQRLLESPIFPDILSIEGDKKWHARAFLQVSSLGFVEHLFLEQPLSSEPMNRALLRMLYGLRFKSGAPSEGWVDIFSPSKGVE